MFEFKQFSDRVEKQKVEIIEDRTDEAYAYLCLWNLSSLGEIDLDKLTIESVSEAKSQLYDSVTYEDEDGMMFLDPHSPGYKVASLGHKINAVERVERIRPTSPYRFI